MDAPVALWRKVLGRLADAGVLRHLVLVGSWCLPCYQDYFAGVPYAASIRTRDVDFLVPFPRETMPRVNLPDVLKDLGFVVEWHAEGYMRLVHPELIIEFLVSERGRGVDHPVPLPLGMNAQALRFLNLLEAHTIEVNVAGHRVRLPHPAVFGLHKLLVAPRRTGDAKATKDRAEGFRVLTALVAKGDAVHIKRFFHRLPRRWQQQATQALMAQRPPELWKALG